ncbi:MAG TPA: nucleotide-binding protein [Methanoregulaceae archaeon]|nr:nucleotide-binding protein [Methanoregulaceae archaeon]HPD75398.1 nucleotide-binding protein [Methanoregulaceae archaeon]
MKVLIDTNALMMPAQFRIDLFGELQYLLGSFTPLVLEEGIRELRGLSSGFGRDGAAARCGLALAEKCTTVRPECPVRGGADAQIIAFAAETGCHVVTNDRRLREELLARGIGVISMRKQKRLELIQR